jgi:hypothetical protein
MKVDGLYDGPRDDFTFRVRRRIQRIMSNSFLESSFQFYQKDFKIVRQDVESVKIPIPFDGYRIAQISDIHFGQWITSKRLAGVVELVNQQDPDLVVITGDFVSYSPDHIEDMVPILRSMRPHDATLAVLGNHDHWLGAEKVKALLREVQIIDVGNDLYQISRSGASLYVAGVDSVMLGKDRLEQALEKLPPGAPAILLAHEPDFADVSSKTGRFILQLSGHSHGGQFVIPEFGTPFRGTLSHKYPHGRYQVGEMVQYTNRGIGTNGFWIRINSPPEITVLELVRGKT